MRNTAECFQAGKSFWEHLRHQKSDDAVAVTVSSADEMLAVIEIRDNAMHAYTSIGYFIEVSMDEFEGLPEAIVKWAKQNHIRCPVEEILAGCEFIFS